MTSLQVAGSINKWNNKQQELHSAPVGDSGYPSQQPNQIPSAALVPLPIPVLHHQVKHPPSTMISALTLILDLPSSPNLSRHIVSISDATVYRHRLFVIDRPFRILRPLAERLPALPAEAQVARPAPKA
jgi:hypothetical protein